MRLILMQWINKISPSSTPFHHQSTYRSVTILSLRTAFEPASVQYYDKAGTSNPIMAFKQFASSRLGMQLFALGTTAPHTYRFMYSTSDKIYQRNLPRPSRPRILRQTAFRTSNTKSPRQLVPILHYVTSCRCACMEDLRFLEVHKCMTFADLMFWDCDRLDSHLTMACHLFLTSHS